MTDPDGVLLPHGGYEHLRSYKVAEAVYDATVVFCDRFIEKRSRTCGTKIRRKHWPCGNASSTTWHPTSQQSHLAKCGSPAWLAFRIS